MRMLAGFTNTPSLSMKTYRNTSAFGFKLNSKEDFPTSGRGSFFGATAGVGVLQVVGSFFSSRDATGFVSCKV